MPLIGAEKTKRNHWCVILVGVTALAGACPLFAGEALAQAVSEPLVHAPVTPISANSLVERAMTMAPAAAREAGGPVRQRGDLELTGPLAPCPLRSLQIHWCSAPSGRRSRHQLADDHPNRGGHPAAVRWSCPAGRFRCRRPQSLRRNGERGDRHLQQVRNKLFGPVAIHTLWAGLGGPCGTLDAGDPIVRYDVLADRWMISQFELMSAFSASASSKGPNPVTDGWHLMPSPPRRATGVKISADYPKIGVWPDGYYMGTQRGFRTAASTFGYWSAKRCCRATGPRDRFQVAAPSLFLLPSDLDGPATGKAMEPGLDLAGRYPRHYSR